MLGDGGGFRCLDNNSTVSQVLVTVELVGTASGYRARRINDWYVQLVSDVSSRSIDLPLTSSDMVWETVDRRIG